MTLLAQRLLALAAALLTVLATARAQAPGVSLSEPFKYGDGLVLRSKILPLGERYFVTLVENRAQVDIAGVSLIRAAVRNKNKLARGPGRIVFREHGADLSERGGFELTPDGTRTGNGFYSLEDNLLWVYTTQRSPDAEAVVHAEVLSPAGETVATHRLLGYRPKDVGTLFRTFAVSPDRSHFALAFSEESANRAFSKTDDAKAELTVVVLDASGALVKQATKRLSVSRDRLDVLGVGVDDAGTAYVAARTFANGKKKQAKDGSDASMNVYHLGAGAEAIERNRLRTKGKYLRSASLVPAADGSLRLFGTYAERRDKEISGFYYLSDPAAEADVRPRAFTTRQLEDMGERVTRKRRGEIVIEGNFEYRDALRRSDGTLTVLLEDYRYVPGMDNPNTGRQSPPRHIFNEGLLFDLSPDGELSDILVVPKVQVSAGGILPFMRMSLAGYDGRPAVLYNDNAKNIGRDLDKRTKPLRAKDAAGMLAYADDDGELVRQPLFSRRETDKMLVHPDSGVPLEGGDVVFFAFRNKFFGKDSYRLGRLEAGARR